MSVEFEERDQCLRDSLELHAQEKAYSQQAVLSRSRADDPSKTPAERANHEKAADDLQAKSDAFQTDRLAAEKKYAAADKAVSQQIGSHSDSQTRAKLSAENMDRKADIQIAYSGNTPTDFTRNNTRQSVQYHEHNYATAAPPSTVQNNIHATDLSKKVEIGPIEKGTELAQHPHAERGAGNYFSKPESTPDRIGIDATHRGEKTIRETHSEARGLKSTAGPAKDTFSHDRTVAQTRGGDGQVVLHPQEQQHLGPPKESGGQGGAFGCSSEPKSASYAKSLEPSRIQEQSCVQKK